MKNKKIVTIFVILMTILTLTTYKVRADSGWDSDYDSGSSWGNDLVHQVEEFPIQLLIQRE